MVPAIERIVETYMTERTSPEETFLQTFRRTGMAPFKTALYGEEAGKKARAA